jgi:hypothetical protein
MTQQDDTAVARNCGPLLKLLESIAGNNMRVRSGEDRAAIRSGMEVIERLIAENEALRAALQPLARTSGDFDDLHPNHIVRLIPSQYAAERAAVRVEALRAARAALQHKGGGE